jgi:hypothetical protein
VRHSSSKTLPLIARILTLRDGFALGACIFNFRIN